jgi:hypothetical protein
MAREPHEQFANWCKHFNGLQNEQCKLGILYESVCVSTPDDELYPCLKEDNVESKCDWADFPTEEETRAHVEEVEKCLKEYIQDLESDICPTCKVPILAKTERHCDVFAEPCGHYLHCGTLIKEAPTMTENLNNHMKIFAQRLEELRDQGVPETDAGIKAANAANEAYPLKEEDIEAMKNFGGDMPG